MRRGTQTQLFLDGVVKIADGNTGHMIAPALYKDC